MTRGTLFLSLAVTAVERGKELGAVDRFLLAGRVLEEALRGVFPRTRECRKPDSPKNKREGEDYGH